jgi:hypothetical protein
MPRKKKPLIEEGIIPITCDPQAVELKYTFDDLVEFQGNLKDLTLSGFEHLKSSLKKHGFFMPVFIWKGKDGEHTKNPFLIDGHQRKRTFQSTGWEIEGGFVPTIAVKADSPTQAAQLVLRFDSQHGTRTPQGLYEFVQTNAISVDDLADFDLPDLNVDKFRKEFFDDIEDEKDDFDDFDEDLETDHTCPKCGYEWSGKTDPTK